ncbi:nickel-binding periplasmic protein precursor [Nitzschia inconspicua]|uniref:Nickel-binding periplasmic protein n=1 Tax=Nitzschia inconspicua TaxID=303405 RepID=A0A9K3LW43_9STRA|nr:nickel-binding periplasmic protein precursor [Nitzschia inconspicua]
MSAPEQCKIRTVDFVIKVDDPEMAAVEDDIREDMAKIGIKVNTRLVEPEEYIKIEENCDYNLFFTRSWGAPYDPHTYLKSWENNAHVEYSATANLQPPLTREILMEKIKKVQEQLDQATIRSMWKEILQDIHEQAIFLPLWGTREPYVLNRRLAGFTPSSQTYTYPIETVRVLSGSKNVTVAPGAGGAMFSSGGPLHPHQYFPNQLFIQDWLYEGLVSYGQDGEIQPALATSWLTEEIVGAGQRVIFTLREGVKFHDGSDFDCASVKLNFDHVLSESARQRHSWLGAVQAMEKWFCNEHGQFVVETNKPFYPLLQELTYIRPLTIAAPTSFANGADSHPELENSCNPGEAKWEGIEALEGFNCAGLSAPVGTGPFKFVSRENNEDGTDKTVMFARHDKYWGAIPDIEFVKLETFENTALVEEALLSGDLDMALGIGPLSALQIQDLKFFHSDIVDVRHSDVLQHSLLVMNTNKEPTNDITVRQAIIHAVNKGRFIEEEFGGLEKPVDQVLPQTAPYCNVDLTPKWSFDPVKAELLACPVKSGLSSGGIAGVTIACVSIVALVGFMVHMIRREKQGKPIFVTPSESAKGEQA